MSWSNQNNQRRVAFLSLVLLLVALLTVVAPASAADAAEAATSGGEDSFEQVDGHDGGGEPSEHQSEEEVHHEEPVNAVLFPWFAQAAGIVVFYLLTRYSVLHGVPYTCVMFILGLVMGVGSQRSGLEDKLTEAVRLWRTIDHEVLLNVFLPGLLFKDALAVNFHLFQASLSQLLILAFPVVLVSTYLTALFAQYVFPYDWSLKLALTFASILAATDPVAVSALLNEVGAPPRLKMHVSGESLLNDGSAVVFYTVFSSLFLYEATEGQLGENVSIGGGFEMFFRMSLGGTAIGIAFAIGLIAILYHLDRRYEHEEIVLQVAATVTVAYLSFYTSEIAAGCSGVIACVTAGIVTKAFGASLISDWQVMDSFWDLTEHLLNSVIFVLGGIEFGFVIAQKDQGWGGREWGYLFLLYVVVNALRFILMFLSYPLLSRIGIKTSVNEVIFSSWAGLRGAVGIALALGLDAEIRAHTDSEEVLVLTHRVFGMVGGIAFLTLVINGTLSGPLLHRLGLAESTESRKGIVKCAESAARQHILDDFIHLMTDSRFYFIDFGLVQHHVPMLQNLTADELTKAVEQNKASVHPDVYQPPHLENIFPYVPGSECLRRDMDKAQRELFMASVRSHELAEATNVLAPGSGGDGKDDPEKGGTGATAAEDAPRQSLILKDIRIMFIELVRAAYNAQIQDGELDPREYEGFLAHSLLTSLELAHDEAVAGKPLDDWNLTQLVTNELVDKTEDVFTRIYGSIFVSKGSPKDRIHKLKDIQPLHYQQFRLIVLRAFNFIDAHREAQDRLRDEFGSTVGEYKEAFGAILAESEAQVQKAEAVLRSKTKKQLKGVISHYLATILQNKLARYIYRLVDSGVLLPREARGYLEEIEHEIRHIRYCRVELHPGTIEVVEERESDSIGPRRRKRIRRDSIL